MLQNEDGVAHGLVRTPCSAKLLYRTDGWKRTQLETHRSISFLVQLDRDSTMTLVRIAVQLNHAIQFIKKISHAPIPRTRCVELFRLQPSVLGSPCRPHVLIFCIRHGETSETAVTWDRAYLFDAWRMHLRSRGSLWRAFAK